MERRLAGAGRGGTYAYLRREKLDFLRRGFATREKLSEGRRLPMPNALLNATSPYLQQHADNPVDWMEWGDTAFARARAEDKPIFLSIGYSTCHWCHVMAHESFEDEGIAAQLNADFVCVKLDREERPDVDKVYMTYVQALTGHGGWPLSVWLTPDLKPMFGGTYFPPQDRGERPGLPKVLGTLIQGWRDDRTKLIEEGDRILERLREHYAPSAEAVSDGAEDLIEPAGDAFERAYQYLYENYDEQLGGFGGAPKFPRSSNLNFLWRCAQVQGLESETGLEALRMATGTLAKMASGGIHDHVGGGFHRYAVDDAWIVPHFEKMLYDQAQIAVNYLDGYAASQNEAMAWTARGVLDYVLRDLRHAAGGFFSAEDADSLPPGAAPGEAKVEGAYYVWPYAEAKAVLGDAASVVLDHFGASESGNVPPQIDPHGDLRGKNVLAAVRPIGATATHHGLSVDEAAARLAVGLERLAAARALRVRPHRDEKIITAWNGLTISALARAATCSAGCIAERRADYRAAAVKAAEFAQRELTLDGGDRLRRAWRDGRGGGEGFAEDYAFLIAGLLDLYEATFDGRWLQWADRLQSTMDAGFADATSGGFFNTREGDASILLRLKDDYDGAEPSPNSVAAMNLLRLGAMLHDDGRLAAGRRTVAALRGQWERVPQAMPEMLCALERAVSSIRQIVIVGDPATPAFAELAAMARLAPGGPRVLLASDGAGGDAWLTERVPELATMRAEAGRAVVYMCHNETCSPAIDDPELLRDAMVVAR